MAKNINHIQHVKSSVVENGKPKLPASSVLVEGEIAVNFADGYETLSIKTTSGNIATFSSDEYYTEQKLGSGFTGENSGVTVTDALDSSTIWVRGEGENSAVLRDGNNVASGNLAVAEGSGTSAMSIASHAEGWNTFAGGEYYGAHAEGKETVAMGYGAHAEGGKTLASGWQSHAEGSYASATSMASHAEGSSTLASGYEAHAEGYGTSAVTEDSHAEGTRTLANGKSAHAEGSGTTVIGDYSHGEGYNTFVNGIQSHAEGMESIAIGNNSHAEGWKTSAYSQSHTEGVSTYAKNGSHAEGQQTTADTYSHAEGISSLASGYVSHAEGSHTMATSQNSHAEGYSTSASGDSSHAEGSGSKASGDYSHAEGYQTSATTTASHSEGQWTVASGIYSHAEGRDTRAIGTYSHAEGNSTSAMSFNSHAEGYYTIANNNNEHASGIYNVSSSASTTWGDSGNTLFSVGDGTADDARHNAFEIRQNGDIYIVNKDGDDVRLQDEIGNIDVDLVIDDTTSASTNPVATKAVYDALVDTEYVWANAYVALSGAISSHTEDLSAHGLSGYVASAEYVSTSTTINFKNASGTVISSIDASAFIKDGMVDNVEIKTISGSQYLVITFNTDSGKEEIDIPLSDIFDSSSYYTKTEIDTKLGSAFTGANSAVTVTEGILWEKGTGVNTIVRKGAGSRADGDNSVSIGKSSSAMGYYCYAEGYETFAVGSGSHAEGNATSATGFDAHAEGNLTMASDYSHAEGSFTVASGNSSHAEGYRTNASGIYSHAEGYYATASGSYSHAEGYYATASGDTSHAEGRQTNANGNYSHAEGRQTNANGNNSHAEGDYTIANGDYSHAEGDYTSAMTFYSHSEGYYTIANGYASHAEGYTTSAMTNYSHAEGQNTTTTNESEHASGQYNISSSASTTFGNSGNTLFSVGNGTYNARHNAFEIRQNGDIYVVSGSNNVKLQDKLINDLEKTNLDSLATNIAAISGITSTKVGNWDTAYANNHTHSNLRTLDEITASSTAINSLTGAVGTMAFQDASSYSSATEVNTALAGKSDTGHTHDDRYYTESELTGSSTTVVVAKAASATTAASAGSVALANVSDADDLKAIEAIAGTSGLLKKTAANTWALDTTTYQAALTEGRAIDITNNAISLDLPISAGTGTNAIIENYNVNVASGNYSHAEGQFTTASSDASHAEGLFTTAGENAHAEGCDTSANGLQSHAEGNNTIANNRCEHASGRYNVSSSASTTWGDSGNTLFSVGNGTSNNERHNAFEIRQNGDVYISSGSTDFKLQDTIADIADLSGQSQTIAAALVELNERLAVIEAALGGMKLQKITQSDYDNLNPKDANTLYIIND